MLKMSQYFVCLGPDENKLEVQIVSPKLNTELF